MNYESPINIISRQMEIQMEGEIMKAVQKVGVQVDKEELIRALKYDRDQYQKGYNDGLLDAQGPVIPTVNEFGEVFCGNCGENVGIIGQSIKIRVRTKYCSECGKKVKWDGWNGKDNQ